MISPSRRDVSLAEQLRRSPRLVPPRFRLVAAEFCPEILLMIFPGRKTSYSQRWAPKACQGAHTLATRVGGAPYPPWHAPCLLGPLVAFRCPSSIIWSLSMRKKIISKLSGRDSAAMRQNLGGTNLGLWRSCSTGETSLREGEIITIDPLIGRGSISINILTSTISSQTLVHLLYPIFVPNPQIGTCGLLVVLITPCS